MRAVLTLKMEIPGNISFFLRSVECREAGAFDSTAAPSVALVHVELASLACSIRDRRHESCNPSGDVAS
jgi:hypothetical protein